MVCLSLIVEYSEMHDSLGGDTICADSDSVHDDDMPRTKVPAPPSQRPSIADRISMLQMAQLQHTGENIPEEGVPLVLPKVPHVEAIAETRKVEFVYRRKQRRWFRNKKRDTSPELISVRLLDESQW